MRPHLTFLKTKAGKVAEASCLSSTLEFLGIWENLDNPDFNPLEFEGVRTRAGLNSFVLTNPLPLPFSVSAFRVSAFTYRLRHHPNADAPHRKQHKATQIDPSSPNQKSKINNRQSSIFPSPSTIFDPLSTIHETTTAIISPAEAVKWTRGASNAGYHDLGRAKTFALMGKAFAEANLEMMNGL